VGLVSLLEDACGPGDVMYRCSSGIIMDYVPRARGRMRRRIRMSGLDGSTTWNRRGRWLRDLLSRVLPRECVLQHLDLFKELLDLLLYGRVVVRLHCSILHSCLF